MGKTQLIYRTQTAIEHDVCKHLTECSSNFIPPLAERINIIDYSKKIVANCITFEAWENDTLVGLIAAYFNDSKKNTAFITNVSVLNNFMGLGVASILLDNCIEYAKKNNYKEIKLEVNRNNNSAIGFYKKFNFMRIETKEDSCIMQFEIKTN